MITLEKLPYEFASLEPVVDTKTVEIHYTKHHQGYVNKLNELVVGTEFENMSLENIIKKAEGAIFNNAAQIWNHTFYRDGLKAYQEENLCVGIVSLKINEQWGNFDKFKEEFIKSAIGNFGSGWTWLIRNPDGSLSILNTSNAQTPIVKGIVPIFVVDVREHAYYLKYQNRRIEYLQNIRNLVDWSTVNKHYSL